MGEPLKTPMYDSHLELGGRMVEFAGHQMPVRYKTLGEEHLCVRQRVGIFDVSHMGEIFISGPDSTSFLQYLSSNNINKLAVGQVQYAVMCNDQGGVVDDLLISRLSEDRFMLCVNASNIGKDLKWITDLLEREKESRGFADVSVEDQSQSWSQIAIQGPKSLDTLHGIFREDFSDLAYYRFRVIDYGQWGYPVIVSRTGYTGELGFEVYCHPEMASGIWTSSLRAGADFDIMPIGLGARDTLRLEMCFSLYGHEIDESISPLEAGLGWIVKLKKGDFCGREVLLAQKESGVKRKIAGFELIEKGIPRQGFKLFRANEEIGYVTSGTLMPGSNRALGLALLDSSLCTVGEEISVEIRGKMIKARVVETPFLKKN